MMKVVVVEVLVYKRRYYLADLSFTLSANMRDSAIFPDEATADVYAAKCERFFEDKEILVSCTPAQESLQFLIRGAHREKLVAEG